jgi:hypothetical protein
VFGKLLDLVLKRLGIIKIEPIMQIVVRYLDLQPPIISQQMNVYPCEFMVALVLRLRIVKICIFIFVAHIEESSFGAALLD